MSENLEWKDAEPLASLVSRRIKRGAEEERKKSGRCKARNERENFRFYLSLIKRKVSILEIQKIYFFRCFFEEEEEEEFLDGRVSSCLVEVSSGRIGGRVTGN
jgi:hypothetical protein